MVGKSPEYRKGPEEDGKQEGVWSISLAMIAGKKASLLPVRPSVSSCHELLGPFLPTQTLSHPVSEGLYWEPQLVLLSL